MQNWWSYSYNVVRFGGASRHRTPPSRPAALKLSLLLALAIKFSVHLPHTTSVRWNPHIVYFLDGKRRQLKYDNLYKFSLQKKYLLSFVLWYEIGWCYKLPFSFSIHKVFLSDVRHIVVQLESMFLVDYFKLSGGRASIGSPVQINIIGRYLYY